MVGILSETAENGNPGGTNPLARTLLRLGSPSLFNGSLPGVKEELWRCWIDVLASALHKQWSLLGHSTRSRIRRISRPYGSPVGGN
jgi:hypothetical protein